MKLVHKLFSDWITWGLLGAIALSIVLARFVPDLRCLVFPFVGALIGYITNVLAVWMIFNPKKPKNFKLFKWQGLVPKSKPRISENLSTTVEKELVNPMLIKDHLMKNDKKIVEGLKDFIINELNKELPSLQELAGDRYYRIKATILDFYESNVSRLVTLVDAMLKEILKRPLREFVGEGQYAEIRNHLSAFIKERIEEVSNRSIGDLVGSRDLKALAENLVDKIDEDAISSLYRMISSKSIHDIYPDSEEISRKVIEFIALKLREPEFRENLARMIINAVRERETLIGRALVNGIDFIIDLEARISDYLENLADRIENDPEFIEDIETSVISFLRQPISSYIEEDKFTRYLYRTLTLIKPIMIENVARISNRPLKDIVPITTLQSLREKFIKWLDSKYRENLNEPVMLDFYEKYRESIVKVMESALYSAKGFIESSLDKLSNKPIGEPSRFFNLEDVIDDFLNLMFPKILILIEELIERINIKTIVRERVDSFSVEEMEEVVFGMMNREFRTIELLGIPIGFLVGFIQGALCLMG